MSNNFVNNIIPASKFESRAGTSQTQGASLIGRVLKVELTDVTELGKIEYEGLYGNNTTTGYAYPLSNNVKHYPLKDEIVYIIDGPSFQMNDNPSRKAQYYLAPYSLWLNSHHNKHPNKTTIYDALSNTQATTEEVQSGVEIAEGPDSKIVADIVERVDVTTLHPFRGDVTMEGRWGNSIRLGSTNEPGTNPWSNQTEKGDPITIITNGLTPPTGDVWSTQLEDINQDASSIWLTTTQEVTLKDIAANFSLESFTSQRGVSKATLLSLQTLPASYEKTSAAQQDRNNNT